ncbi:MAG: Coenzyme F420 hydrogenase/dehydrogenase, beta subunit C-terminal domain [Rhizobiaceae bacterium]
MKMSPEDRMNSISEQGMCAGCGLCQAIAGSDRISVTKSANGYERPVVVDKLNQEIVEQIFDVCPGTHIEGLPESEICTETNIDKIWGPWLRMVLAWAAHKNTRFEGSTGGVLTALADFLLADGRVNFILHVKASEKEPTFGKRHLSFNHADVLEAAGSRYGPAAPLIDVDQVLDRGQPFAFIGKPCDIAALRNLARHDPRVDRLVKYWLTPVCGGYMPPPSLDAFLNRAGVSTQDIKSFRYRGLGCPGPTRVETETGIKDFHYLDLWGEDESAWQLPFRCKICPDGIGEAADIAASDTWPGGSPTREESMDDPGTNAAVVRTVRGLELLEAAEKAGFLTLGSEVTPDDMNTYQPHQVRKKFAVQDRHLGMGDEGRIVPVTKRLRIDELAAEMPAEFSKSQREGTRKRIAEGKTSEPTPVSSK